MQAGLSHQRQQSDGFKDTVLPPVFGPVTISRREILAEPYVDRNNLFRIE